MKIISTVERNMKGRKGAQNYGKTRTLESTAGVKYRLTVNIDAYYPAQSRIYAETWTPVGWVEVHKMPDGKDRIGQDTVVRVESLLAELQRVAVAVVEG